MSIICLVNFSYTVPFVARVFIGSFMIVVSSLMGVTLVIEVCANSDFFDSTVTHQHIGSF